MAPGAYAAEDSILCINRRRGLWSSEGSFSSVGECQGPEVERVVRKGSTFMKTSGGGDGSRGKGDNI